MEIWKAVVGYEGFYEVSDQGRVRSLPRTVPSRGGFRVSPGRMRALVPKSNRYLTVILSKQGAIKCCHVHQLVLGAFVGPCPAGMETLHYDGDKTNNNLINLRYGSRSENRSDGKRLGRDNSGERNGHAKLTYQQVHDIRRRCAAGETQRALAVEHGVTFQTINKVVQRETWDW